MAVTAKPLSKDVPPMPVTKTRAALAAFLLTGTAYAFTAAQAQDARSPSNSDGSRIERKAPAKAAPTPPLSSSVAKALTTAQTDIGANKLPEALIAVKEALAASKTDYEKMKSNQFLTNVLAKQGDNAGAAAAAMAAADTPPDSIPAEDKAMVYTNATALALNTYHADKALIYAMQMIALNPYAPRAQDYLGRALYASGDPAGPAYFLLLF